MKHVLAVVVVLLSLCQPLMAQTASADSAPLRVAHEAYYAGYPKDRAALLALGRAGNGFAAVMLERTWQLESYGPPSEAPASHWRGIARRADALERLNALAAQGNTLAMTWLGTIHSYGLLAVEQDLAQGTVWYLKAAEKGDASAQSNLGYAYSQGNGVPKDDVQSAFWLRKAADQGVSFAQYNLGVLYSQGRGVPKDDMQAVRWIREAADRGYGYAQNHLALAYVHGMGVSKDDVQAASWFRKAADQGYANAQSSLGLLYGSGRGVPQDHAQAALWFRKAADQGDAAAQFNLGYAYDSGRGVPKDHVQAIYWLRKAADQGNADAQRRLAAGTSSGNTRDAEEDASSGFFRSLIGATVGATMVAAAGGDTEQVLGGALKAAQVFNPDSAATAAMGSAGDALLGGSPSSSAAAAGSGLAQGGASYPTRPNQAAGACPGFTEANYRQRAVSGGGDQQLYAMCGQAFEYYTMYKRAIAQGYSEADANRTYAAHEQAARVASGFRASHGAD